jgi:hypothetical protein
MRAYNVNIKGFHKYYFERDIVVRAVSEGTAINRALKEFWKDPANKKRKRNTKYLKIHIDL